MKFAVSHSLKRAGAGVAIAAALISATGCGYIYTQPTTPQYAASDGVKADLNGVELRNIMMVSSGKGADGRLLGTILNKSDHDITVTFAFPSGEKSVKVAKGQQVRLESNDSQVIVPKISQTPGETLANTQVSSNDQSTNLNIPILDGTLKEYASYMPNAASSRASSQSSHAATPSASTPAKTPTPSASATAVPTNTSTAVPTAPEPAETPSYDESEEVPAPAPTASVPVYENVQ